MNILQADPFKPDDIQWCITHGRQEAERIITYHLWNDQPTPRDVILANLYKTVFEKAFIYCIRNNPDAPISERIKQNGVEITVSHPMESSEKRWRLCAGVGTAATLCALSEYIARDTLKDSILTLIDQKSGAAAHNFYDCVGAKKLHRRITDWIDIVCADAKADERAKRDLTASIMRLFDAPESAGPVPLPAQAVQVNPPLGRLAAS